MELGIRGRKAIIKGGSAGLGFGAGLALAHEGVELFISARNEARLNVACGPSVRRRALAFTPLWLIMGHLKGGSGFWICARTGHPGWNLFAAAGHRSLSVNYR